MQFLIALFTNIDAIAEPTSDESKPEPELELKDSQLGSARDLFLFSSKSKIGRNEPKFLIFLIFFHLCSYILVSTSQNTFYLIYIHTNYHSFGYNHDAVRTLVI